MKIALLSFEYPPETGFGGIGTYTWHHARALRELGHEVHVLAGASEPSPLRSEDQEGVQVHRFWADGLVMRILARAGSFRWWWTQQRLQNAWSMFQGMRALLRNHRFDILEMPECGAEGALITRWTGVPTVVRLHSPSALIMPYYDVRQADTLMCSAIEKRAMIAATAMTACSRFVAEQASQELGIARSCQVISNGLDLGWMDRAFEPRDVHARHGLRRGVPTIVFAGRMEKRKGIALMNEIATSILERFDVNLVLSGEDLFGHVGTDLLPRLAARRLKGSVHAVGKLPMADLRELVRTADVVLLPSLWENCPYSCLEAMAAGRAVVASNQGGMPEIIRDGVDGLLADVGDAPAFVASIERLIEDAELRSRLGREARKTIERSHDASRLAQAAVAIYQGTRSAAP
ncbi:glycosyltransferase family 4 protein [Thermomonas carbonis]|uniref:Glycosyltransferase family 4 protein n=1 Tax=Thermomonas carbonis TaxID=1463158 RepID=A0A7G9SMR3_9GAMM|nr:glycosyltransferase family 4 protein [Thermomonas carbonis]QNN69138.1 glycosyltransferase family 4 protein [Thermomonas carbonis]GHC06508.1 glycosyl transferase family 1 [Thermomonas carbonis]